MSKKPSTSPPKPKTRKESQINTEQGVEELLVEDKKKAKNEEIRTRIKYKALFFAVLFFFILVLALGGFFYYNLFMNVRDLRRQKKKDENIYDDQQIKIHTLEDENKKQANEILDLKEQLLQKSYSEESLKKEVSNLKQDNQKITNEFNQLKSDNRATIEKLFAENQELRKELGKDLQEELRIEKMTPYPDKWDYILVCQKCPDSVPLLTVNEVQGKIKINEKCNECDSEQTYDLNEFIYHIMEVNKSLYHYCEKADGSHSHKKATHFYNGKYYCNECAESLKSLVDRKDLKEIEHGVIYSEEKYKYYCPNCHKHYEEGFSIEEHNPGHKVIDLDNLNKKMDLENYTSVLEEAGQYINDDLGDIQEKIIKSLPELLNEVNKKVAIYQNKIDAMVYLGKIIQFNYEKNKNFPNYFIIKNMLNFSKIMVENFYLKDLQSYNLNGINVMNIGTLFKQLGEKLIDDSMSDSEEK